ncbi:NAD(P)-dependent oxidoreductase [Nocardia nova]|uniref:NAD(P)-dependent oxidoreductase n=1 Tax=Nocardia nova TaxID=37330 RepID=UPI0025AFBC19|nr:NAD(P)-binding domain-containing protein [Nocardia nova]
MRRRSEELRNSKEYTMSERSSVTVIGLGPMGRAIVRVLLAAGTEVTVWNRSADKAEAMAELGARRAESVADALERNEVIILSLTDYAAMYDVLGRAPERLRDRVIVNLSSDSPERTRAGARWVRSHGARFLSGGFMSAGDNITHPASYIFYSGPREVFDAHADLLRPLSAPEYLGADDGLAQLFYQALLTLFHPWLIGYNQALAVVERAGHDIDRFLPFAQRSAEAFPFFMAEYATAAKSGGWGDDAAARMMVAGAAHVVETSAEVGVDATLSHTVRELWEKVVAAGAGLPMYRLLRDGV